MIATAKTRIFDSAIDLQKFVATDATVASVIDIVVDQMSGKYILFFSTAGVICAYSVNYLWFDGAVPANNSTVTIAGHVFKFVTALPITPADAITYIKIAGTVNANLDLLVKAVNGTVDALNIKVSSPDFTSLIGAARDATYGFYIYNSTARGGAIAIGTQSITCATTVTGGAWWNTNLNAMPGETMPVDQQFLFTNIPTSATLFARSPGLNIAIRLSFVPKKFTASIFDPGAGSFVTDAGVNTWIQPDGVNPLIPFAYSGGAYPGAIITILAQ
jgi:hypothetical protein